MKPLPRYALRITADDTQIQAIFINYQTKEARTFTERYDDWTTPGSAQHVLLRRAFDHLDDLLDADQRAGAT